MNVVMTGAGEFVEVQGTAEQVPFGRARLDSLLAIAEAGIRRSSSRSSAARSPRARVPSASGHALGGDSRPRHTESREAGASSSRSSAIGPSRSSRSPTCPARAYRRRRGRPTRENALVKARAAAE